MECGRRPDSALIRVHTTSVSKTRANGDLSAARDAETIDLQPGDWVEVRPFEAIAPTLDEEQKHGGLLFVPGMKQFCGRAPGSSGG